MRVYGQVWRVCGASGVTAMPLRSFKKDWQPREPTPERSLVGCRVGIRRGQKPSQAGKQASQQKDICFSLKFQSRSSQM